MATTLAFDVYGTLINTEGVLDKLNKIIPLQAENVMHLWRSKQLEYTFRRGLMQVYVDFNQCTREALQFALSAHKVDLDSCLTEEILSTYADLPAFADALSALKKLNENNFCCVAFSNGRAQAVEDLLNKAGLLSFFKDIVSVEAVKTFKPHPKVYQYLCERCSSKPDETWLISGNSFDVMGAAAAGLRSIWVQREASQKLDFWEWQPEQIISDLNDLVACFGEKVNSQ